MEIIGEIVVGILAFVGAYLGTKRIKKYLIDNYIEDRVTKAQNVNDKVLSKARDIISSFEQTYTENKPVSKEELSKIVEQCRKLSKKSEDGGKEVSSVSYLLYHTIRDLKPRYGDKEEGSIEILTLGDVVYLVGSSLRLIIYYCTNSAPIPFRTKLKRRSVIKRKLRIFLKDKKFYSLKHQPFGLTLDPNSEVIIRYSEILRNINSSIYSRNLFLFLQSNIPILYQMIVNKIYMPLILNKEQKMEGFLFDHRLYLIKITEIKSVGEKSGDFVEFYYSNINPVLRFVGNMNLESFKSNFTSDAFLNKNFQLNENYELRKQLNETIQVKVSLKKAKSNYKKNKWSIKHKLYKYKLTH